MSDTKIKQTTHKKPVSNSLRLKAASKNTFNGSVKQKNMANILNRLPFLHQLKEAENSLLKLLPLWLKWCALQQNSNALRLNDLAQLKDLTGGILTIDCETPTAASLIKHQQTNLLTAFHKAGFNHILSLKVLVSPSSHLSSADKNTSKTRLTSPINDIKDACKKPNKDVLKAIKTAQSHTKNEQLAASLSRLAETLKKTL